MPFGKYKGHAVHEIDTGYLTWCANTCKNLTGGVRAAIEAELAARNRDLTPEPLPEPAAIDLAAIDRRAVYALLNALVAAEVRVVARGNGAVHLYAPGGELAPALRADLERLHGDLDAWARWVAWESPSVQRQTPAAAA